MSKQDNLSFLSAMASKPLLLRPLEPDDAEPMRALTDDPLILAAIPFLERPFTRADAMALILARGDSRNCFIGAWQRDAMVPPLIGMIGVHLRGAVSSRSAGRRISPRGVC